MISQQLQGLRALIVEDEYLIATETKQLLLESGADVVVMSGDIDDAIKQVREDDFGFVLLDINVHGELAFKLADMLLGRDMLFGFVTGYERSTLPTRFASVPHWAKPYNRRQIVDEIARLWLRPVKT